MSAVKMSADTFAMKTVGELRALRRMTSSQSTLPSLVEESEDTQQEVISKTLADSIEPTDLNANGIMMQQQFTANSVQAEHFTARSLNASQQANQLLPEICEGSMAVSTSTNANHLLAVPDHFLSSAPDLTQSSDEGQKSQASPDLLRVETPVKVKDMSPQPRETQAEDTPAECVTVPTRKVEESQDSTSPTNRIYGRFSSADESLVSEKKGEELESKFVMLTAGLDTQKETLNRRLEVCQHTRSSTEESLRNEINSLLEEIRGLIAQDTEAMFRHELRNVEKRLEKVVPVAVTLESKAETCGAVKQEQKQLKAAVSMVEYVEHLKRINARETNDHHATRVRLLKAQQEWNMGDMTDNPVNVNITRRSSTIVGGQTQTLGKRRASVAITALPNILGGQGLRQLSILQKSQSTTSLLKRSNGTDMADPRSKFQQLVRKSSLHNTFRRGSQDSTASDYVELPAVTVSRPTESPSVPDTPIDSPIPTRHASFSAGDKHPFERNNNSQHNLNHVAVIKTICAATPTVETVEKPEKAEVKTAIRRRRSIKRTDTSTSQRSSIDTTALKMAPKPSLLSLLFKEVDESLSKYSSYRSFKEQYHIFDERHRRWRRQLQDTVFIIVLFILYLKFRLLHNES